MEPKIPGLSQKDHMKAALRLYLLQNTFNYTSCQRISYLYMIMSALKKIYKDKPEKLRETAGTNLEFYNASPQMLPSIASMQLAMYDNGQSVTDTRSIEMALMGPLPGIGDPITQFGIAPLFSTIFAGLAVGGLGFAPMSFRFSMLVPMLIVKLLMGCLGFKFGTSVIEALSDKVGKISSTASTVGITVIAALVTSFVKVSIAIKYPHHAESGEKQVIVIQGILDKTMSKIFLVILTILAFYLIGKRSWNTHKLLILLSAIGIAASVPEILA